jgi:hypothetical protein
MEGLMGNRWTFRDDGPTALVRYVGAADGLDLWLTQTSTTEGSHEIEFHAVCDGPGTGMVDLACSDKREVQILFANAKIIMTGFVVRFELVASPIETEPLCAKFWMVLSRSAERE